VNQIERHERTEEKKRSWVRLYVPDNAPEEETYDWASTTLVGNSSDVSNRSCLKSDLFYSLEHVEGKKRRVIEGDPLRLGNHHDIKKRTNRSAVAY
jgi:hypothetical protein